MKFLILIMFFTVKAFALETDNYVSWNLELRDSRQDVNQYFSAEIEKVLRKNAGKDKSCGEITAAIARNFKSIGVKNNPVENYIVARLGKDQIFPQSFDYVDDSIYRDPFLPHLRGFGLSPNIQVNGYYIGTDKLSHFASTGYIYYLIWSVSQKNGEEEALKNAITYGVKDEQSLHGYWASGVFSFADLEANFQGLHFYRRMCGEKNAYLTKDESGDWKLTQKPDFADYVSGDWDETYRRSYFVNGNWAKVAPVLETYCESLTSEKIKQRHNFYRTTAKKSFSSLYLDGLKAAGEIQKPQSLEVLCAR